jgi:hypothetical protein
MVVVPTITVVHAIIKGGAITGNATDIGLSSNRAHQKKGPCTSRGPKRAQHEVMYFQCAQMRGGAIWIISFSRWFLIF